MNLLSPLKRVADRIFHGLFRFAVSFSRASRSNAILLVRTDGIGDLVYCIPFVQAIRNRHPGSKIVLCATGDVAELARAMPVFDDVVGFARMPGRRNYMYRLRLLRRVRLTAPKVAVNLSFHREHLGDEITLLSGAPETIAFSGNDECIHLSMRLRNNREYSRVLDVGDNIPERDKYFALMAALGAEKPAVNPQSGDFHSIEIDAKTSRHEIPGTQTGPYLVLGPGGSAAIRRWPAENFSSLADIISREFDLAVVVSGNREERGTLLRVAGTMKRKATVSSDLNILSTTELLTRSSLFVGNESGLLHLAATLGVPGVGILGGGHFNRYFPYGSVRIVHHPLDCYECNWKCKFPEPYCITDITVEDVAHAVRSVMAGLRK